MKNIKKLNKVKQHIVFVFKKLLIIINKVVNSLVQDRW